MIHKKKKRMKLIKKRRMKLEKKFYKTIFFTDFFGSYLVGIGRPV